MAETLELQQVICPSCKQAISSFSPFAAQVECPYCHNKAFNPLITAKKVPIPERLIVFKTTEKDFEQSMVNHLIEKDYVPTDIFQCINPDNVIKAYLPMFLYEGTYQSSWTCSVARRENELRANSKGDKLKNKTVTKYIPYSGTSQGNFSFLCLAYDGNEIPAELSSFCSQFPYRSTEAQEYDPDLLGLDAGDSPMTIALNTDPETIWSQKGEGLVENLARRNAEQQLSNEDFYDFNASSSHHLEHCGRYVLAPFWFVYYTYNNEKYYFLMDGLGEKKALSAPVDEDEVNYIKELKSSRYKKLWWILPLFFLIGILAKCDEVLFGVQTEGNPGPMSIIGVLLFFGVVIKMVVDFIKAGKEIEERMSDAKEQRRAAARKIGC